MYVCMLYSVLQLDGSPHAMAFSSPTAHITIALHKHLHSIEPSTC